MTRRARDIHVYTLPPPPAGFFEEIGIVPECDEPHAPDCWRCGGAGLVEPFEDDAPRVVIHHAL